MSGTDDDRKNKAQGVKQNKSEGDYGYYFYPERSGEKVKRGLDFGFLSTHGQKIKCIANVHACLQKDHKVKLLMSALKSHGCPISVSRHISCERCLPKVNGGFDPVNKQIVVCENNTSSSRCCSVLAHELIHMFDYCRAHVDFKNIEHLACTEIRAASIMHCSYKSAVVSGAASIFNIKRAHQECVKRKALMSVIMVRNVDIDEATKVIDKVFDKCYNDLEPFGKIPRSKSNDPEKMLSEGYLYGYTDRKK